jgi:hypothetical protein
MELLVQPHWEALTPLTRQAYEHLGQLTFIQRFYLAGGTGLALHLGHRFSVDLDFFSTASDAVGLDERAELRALLDDPSLAITYDKDATFVATWNQVGISFFRLSQYSLVQAPLWLEGAYVATMAEIGAMKLAAIIARGARKDLVDLYFIFQAVPLEQVFQVAAQKYARVRSFPVSATRGLAYFVDAEAQPMPRMLDRTPWSKMKRFLEHQALEVGRQRLADLWT